jgi:hypothetical protein
VNLFINIGFYKIYCNLKQTFTLSITYLDYYFYGRYNKEGRFRERLIT